MQNLATFPRMFVILNMSAKKTHIPPFETEKIMTQEYTSFSDFRAFNF